MKHIVTICVLWVLTVLATGCTEDGKGRKTAVVNSKPPVVDSAMALYDQAPERALQLLDSATRTGDLDEELATMLKAKVYAHSTTEQHLDTARQMLEGLVESDFVKDNEAHRETVLDLLIYVSRQLSDNVQYLRWSTEKVKLCRDRNDETEALRTEAEIGLILTQIGDEERGIAKLNGVIAALEGQRHFNEMDACIIALKRKVSALGRLGRPAEVVPHARQIIAKIDDYRAHPVDYSDGSFRQPHSDESFRKYCDFYTVQAYAILARAYGEMGSGEGLTTEEATAAERSAWQDSARRYLDLYERSDQSRTPAGRRMLASIYRLLGEYDKMLETYETVAAEMGDDTVNRDYAHMLHGRALAAEAAGDPQGAIDYLHRHNNLTTRLCQDLMASRTYEYAARYHLQEAEEENARLTQKAGRLLQMVFVLAGVTLAALAAAAVLLGALLVVRRRRRRTTPHMDEEEASDAAEAEAEEPEAKTPDITEGMTEAELFDYIADIVRSEGLYLDPQFGRQTLIDRLGISKNRIGAAFAQGSHYTSVSEFVRDLRLEHACRLLTERPEMGIGEVAAASGFGNPTVFGRYFKNRYEVSPTDYRSSSLP